MNNTEFNKILEQFSKEEEKLERTKGNDYTIGSDDRLNNFKTVGSLVHCPHCKNTVGPRVVWAIYKLKHVLALLAWVKTGKVESEGLFGRFSDDSVYNKLGYAIHIEETPKIAPTQTHKTGLLGIASPIPRGYYEPSTDSFWDGNKWVSHEGWAKLNG